MLHHTLVDTSFKLISDFFHVNRVVSMLSKLGGGGATGLLNKGGRSNRLPGLVTKQQAVEFPQVLTSNITIVPLEMRLIIQGRFQKKIKGSSFVGVAATPLKPSQVVIV